MWEIVIAAAISAGLDINLMPAAPLWEEMERLRMERLERELRHDARFNMAFMIAIAASVIAFIVWCVQ